LILGLILLLATALRVGAAVALPAVLDPPYQGRYYFPDSELYWKLALQLYHGRSYTDGARVVLRTPAYPAFLAICMHLVGPEPHRVRILQAAVCGLVPILLYQVWRRLLSERVALLGAVIAALYPSAVLMSVLLLSEGLFSLWVAGQLAAVAAVFDDMREEDWHPRRRPMVVVAALMAGLLGGFASLTRPVWMPVTLAVCLFLLLGLYRVRLQRGQLVTAVDWGAIAIVLLAFLIVCTPWWVRNRIVTGHWVWGSLWGGASLYDGLNPRATGQSDMRFMVVPEAYGLSPHLATMDEYEQDLYLRKQAWEFVRRNPGRVLWLAVRKQMRFWSIVPSAPGWNGLTIRLVCGLVWGTTYLLGLWGLWLVRRRPFVLFVLAGPLLYTASVHLLFVGSIRYREPVLLPALGLVAMGLWERLSTLSRRRGLTGRAERG